MMEEYPILFHDNTIGTAIVERQGLYYRIQCRCSIRWNTPCRIKIDCSDFTTDLGICVPTGKDFGLIARIPMKRIGEGALRFYAVQQKECPNEKFIPILPQKPFENLSRLRTAILEHRDGIIGLRLTDPSAAPQGSDPNQESGNR